MGNTLHSSQRSDAGGSSPQRHAHAEDHFTCLICADSASALEKQFRNANRCSHPFCTDCVLHYIRVRLEDDPQSSIRCPMFDCRHNLDPVASYSVVGDSLFVQWCDALFFESLFDVEKCHCPYMDCNEVILNECGGNLKKTACPKCKRLFCFKCCKVWHEGGACEAKDELAFRKLANSMKWKRCPRCKYFVERKGGCRIIACRCGRTFCYKCGQRLFDGSRCGCKRSMSSRFFHRMCTFINRYCLRDCLMRIW